MDVYFAEYSEEYINTSSTVNALQNLENGNYDYIEMMEIIEDNISETVETLNDRGTNDPYYRATSTGKSFSDLASEFYYIQSVNVSKLYSDILEYQITKDKNLLLSQLSGEDQQLPDFQRLGTGEDTGCGNIDQRLCGKDAESGNTNITYEYILDDIYEKNLVDTYGKVIGEGDQTVTYDKLIYSWRDHNESKEFALIDAAYCNYIIGVFSQCSGADGGRLRGDE